MTSAWFAHFADDALAAADFITQTNPAAARRFGDAAKSARRLSGTLARQERLAQLSVELVDIRLSLGGPSEED